MYFTTTTSAATTITAAAALIIYIFIISYYYIIILCIYIGDWSERVSPEGRLVDVLIKDNFNLQEQFPLSCKISNNIVHGNMTSKTVVYRSTMRVDGGQHQIWCSKLGASQYRYKKKSKDMVKYTYKQYNRMEFDFNVSCRQHIFFRNKIALEEFIFDHLPAINRYPR
jgi:hypothetical protein